uniref:Uncharacterized protein n=1 Tax=Rhizophora mucronata TaxID=61149 RepID=A0A2P2NB70_RHIMU
MVKSIIPHSSKKLKYLESKKQGITNFQQHNITLVIP